MKPGARHTATGTAIRLSTTPGNRPLATGAPQHGSGSGRRWPAGRTSSVPGHSQRPSSQDAWSLLTADPVAARGADHTATFESVADVARPRHALSIAVPVVDP